MRKYDYLLVIVLCMALLSADALLGLALIAAYTIIGIPIAPLIMALPAFALILVPARLFERLVLNRFFPASRKTAFGAIAIMLAASSLFAIVDNAKQSKVVDEFLAGDFDTLQQPIPKQKIALVSAYHGSGCLDFCQRLLLTGQANSVLVESNKDKLGDAVPDFSGSAKEFRLEDLGSCPLLPGNLEGHPLTIAGEPTGLNAPRAYKMILQAAVAGRCLTETNSTLAAADLLISDEIVQSRQGDSELSFALGEPTIEVNRREVWIKRDGQQMLAARWTHALVPKFPLIALPVAGEGFRVAARKGFWRITQEVPEPQPDIATFAHEIIGLRLSLMDPELLRPALGDTHLLRALNATGPLAPQIFDLIHDQYGLSIRGATATPEMRTAFQQVFADTRIPLSPSYYWAINTLLDPIQPEFAAAVAETGFRRLAHHQYWFRVGVSWRVASGLSDNGVEKVHLQQMRFASNLLAALPKEALQPYGSDIVALANDRDSRRPVSPLLKRLADFGELGARALIAVLSDPPSDKVGHDLSGDEYKAAIDGLCRMGPEARVVLPEFLDLIQSKKVSLKKNLTSRPAFAILIQMGLPKDRILELASADPPYAEQFEQALSDPASWCR